MRVTNRTAASARKPDVQCSFIEHWGKKMFFCHLQVKMRRKKEKGRDHNPNHHFYLRDKDESVFLAQNI